MNDLSALQALTAQMYAHTRACENVRTHSIRSESHQYVRTAPLRKLSDAERASRFHQLQEDIAEHYLNSPPPASVLREGLSRWQGARVRS